MIAFFKRLNAQFISVVLTVVYFIGVGIARLLYVVGAPKETTKDSYWIHASKTQNVDDGSSAY